VLQNLVKSFFIIENERLLDHTSVSAKAHSSVSVPLKGMAINKALARKSIKDSGRKANKIAGVKFTTVTTNVEIAKVTPLENMSYLVDVVEKTVYGYDDNTPPYEYRALHQVTFTQAESSWIITNIKSLDPMSDVRDEKVLQKIKGTSAKSAEKSLSIIVDMKAAIDRNLSVLKMQDQMKREGQSPLPLSNEKSKQGMVVTKDDIPKAGIARPESEPLLNTNVPKWKDGGGPPYSYSDMVSWALMYATDTPVDYSRE
jgi:hypothetical protein